MEDTGVGWEARGSPHLWYEVVKRCRLTCVLVPRSCRATFQKGNEWAQKREEEKLTRAEAEALIFLRWRM